MLRNDNPEAMAENRYFSTISDKIERDIINGALEIISNLENIPREFVASELFYRYGGTLPLAIIEYYNNH